MRYVMPHCNVGKQGAIIPGRVDQVEGSMLHFKASKLAIVVAVCATAAMANDLDAAGRAKLAEMMAFVRDGPDQCGAAPVEQVVQVFALYIGAGKKAPLEDEIAAKQDELAAMKPKMGVAKWCALFRLEMEE